MRGTPVQAALRLLLVPSLLLLVPLAAARAQDSVIVLDPNAPFVDTLQRVGPPPEVIEELLAVYNDSGTTRIQGDFTLPAGSRVDGRLAVYRGTVRLAGAVRGSVTVINGTLHLFPGAAVEGGVLVVGGRLLRADDAKISGRERVFWDAAPVAPTADGRLALRERPRSLADFGAARATFQRGPVRGTLHLGTGGTYNRVEGLEVELGAQVDARLAPELRSRLDLSGILRTAGSSATLPSEFGYRARLELRAGQETAAGLAVGAFAVVDPIEQQPLSLAESGWSSFLVQRDYRDWYRTRGIEGEIFAEPVPRLRLALSLRREDQSSVAAADPWSLFRNEDRWRANPLVDDGRYVTGAVAATLDTRNSRLSPSSGWYLQARYERASSNEVAPLLLPTTLRAPIPTQGYDFDRLSLDLRRYSRLTPSLRISGRLLADGWVGGDALPVQRRVSLGGPDLLPGYGFRALSCGVREYNDPADPALCDRMIATQIEVRSRVSLNFGVPVGSPDAEPRRFLGIGEADLVFFGDAGNAWLAGDGPGRVPADRLPVLREWKADVGAGLDAGALGLYLAKALTDREPLRLIVRLQRRF